MSIAGTVVLAVDGTHCAGKSTLAGDLVRHYRSVGVDVALAGDVARESPLTSAVITAQDGRFGLDVELDPLAATVTTQLRTAAGHQLLVTDKTAANVRAYAELLLSRAELDSPTWSAAAALCDAWRPYDLVVKCTDQFHIDLADDGYRIKVADLQLAAHVQINRVLAESGYPVIDLPAGLDARQRVAWLVEHPRVTAFLESARRSPERDAEAPEAGDSRL